MDMGKGAAPPSAVRAPLRGGAARRYSGDARPREERAPRRFTRLVRVLVKLAPPPLRVAGALAIAYWNTHGPGTGPSTRRPLGAPA
ncbi:hypothetical protein [Streptomyces atroolivaceus]|uniref:Uncharacterized protein n=1 Tax=Streptomyces atroolivaceus TaxID=66869 RepID=A0ABV9V8P6_STRAZ|nr:hypothetical protein [Streptomyces atroolivaceus]